MAANNALPPDGSIGEVASDYPSEYSETMTCYSTESSATIYEDIYSRRSTSETETEARQLRELHSQWLDPPLKCNADHVTKSATLVAECINDCATLWEEFAERHEEIRKKYKQKTADLSKERHIVQHVMGETIISPKGAKQFKRPDTGYISHATKE